VHSLAGGCYTIDAARPGSGRSRFLTVDAGGDGFGFDGRLAEDGARFHLRAADLGTYLLYDGERHYVVAEPVMAADSTEAWRLGRVSRLESDLTLLDDTFISPAEWDIEVSGADPERFWLKHRATDRYLTHGGSLSEDTAGAATVTFYPSDGCADHPELTVDADGAVDATPWPDGDVFGFVETHAHLFTNFGFGGAGMFHGSPFHRLGVEHALPSCEQFHGPEGRRDLIDYAFSGLNDIDVDALASVFVSRRTPEANHVTDGYPLFTEWPNGWRSSTHQTQYYRWIERAYLAGMRLLVQHATGNSVLCEMMVGLGAQPARYSCNDMVSVDRQIDETLALERYVDAQSGGPGRGFFRVVTSPADARRVIGEGKLAVVLGIEISDVFDCFLTPQEGFATCDEAFVIAELDRYHARGVRALFPAHKFDNGFTSGDGDRRVGQVGSFINSGHWSNFVTDCPPSDAPFDHGDVLFAGLNMPRAEYASPPPNDMSGFADDPIATVLPHLPLLMSGSLTGDHCQATGLTALGELLLREMMARGMIIEVDHLSRRAYERTFEILMENDYPAAATHGSTAGGRVYELGGISNTGLGRCGDPGNPGRMGEGFVRRIQNIRDHGGYPAEGFGFDLNGFAGAPRPRFGPDSRCTDPQAAPITYPFTSYRGDVTFTEPRLGDRTVDFNTEGMIHLGLVAELIEDVRRDGTGDRDLEPLFRSAEGYLRMWEKAEARAAALR
jgi:microsomal dipeptidase-like Zn-dependent dipeptidase